MKFIVYNSLKGYAVEAKCKYEKGHIYLDHFEWSSSEGKAQSYDTEDDWGRCVAEFLAKEANSVFGNAYSILTDGEPTYEVTYFGNRIDGESVLIVMKEDGKPSISFRLTKDISRSWILTDKALLKPFAKIEGLAVKENKPLVAMPLEEFLSRSPLAVHR